MTRSACSRSCSTRTIPASGWWPAATSACRNQRLALQRARTRESLLQTTEELLAPIRAGVAAGRLHGESTIGLRVGAVPNRYKVRKHFECTIGDPEFAYRRRPNSIAHEAALDGVYVIRTSLAAGNLSAPDCVRSYKALTRVERAFRTLKTADLQVRPFHHRLAKRKKATRRAEFELDTQPSAKQARVLELLKGIRI